MLFSHWLAFDNITQLIIFIKSAFFKKWIECSLLKEQVKLLPVPVVPDGISALMWPNITHCLYNSPRVSLSKKRAITLQ